MSHDLSIRQDGYVEMAYAGEKPWHGLGQSLRDGAPIEEWEQAAGMDWRIKRSRVRFATAADSPMEIDESNHVLFRSDTNAPLSIVSPTFKIVQPKQTLEFFRDLVESAGYQLNTAGVLKGGRKFWAQATNGMEDNIVGNDVVKARLLIATSCDGSMATIVKNVAERVVCANTLAMAMSEGGQMVKVSHRSKFDATQVKGKLGISVEDFEQFIARARLLASASMDIEVAEQFLQPLFELTPDDVAEGGRKLNGYNKVLDLFKGAGRGANLAGVQGTAWGLVNAVTEFVDHHRGNAGTTRDNRLDYAWFGAGDALKTQAFDKAVLAFA